jgi:hypothetical protein
MVVGSADGAALTVLRSSQIEVVPALSSAAPASIRLVMVLAMSCTSAPAD